MKIDMHLHTELSDGVISVEQLMNDIYEQSICICSKTDHDTIQGNDSFEKMCKSNGIKYIEGVELSSHLVDELKGYDKTFVVHILAYGANRNMMELYCEKVMQKRQESLHRIYQDLVADGYEMDISYVENNERRIVDRTAIAKELVRKGYYATIRDAFDKKLNTDEYIFKSVFTDSPKEIIKEIHKCGGIAVWAHPYELARGRKVFINIEQVSEVLQSFMEYGIDGIETYYQRYSDEERRGLHNLALEYGLLESMGSDYHGRTTEEKNLLSKSSDSNLVDKLLQKLHVESYN